MRWILILLLSTSPAAAQDVFGGFLGGVVGGVIGSQIRPPRYYAPPSPPVYYQPAPVYVPQPQGYYVQPDAVAYCMNRFRSYNPQTGVYVGYDGYYHRCP